ncbi:MAG: hypothetical protein JWM16_294 [Verrucomicrobiales bacterium]|nr:hypothetical protein [Verrucomicrobiales bacterium]
MDTNWATGLQNMAVVLDLAGTEGVSVGLHLAERGYRPVPLYNALPWPGRRTAESLPPSVVLVEPIMSALWHGTSRLAQCAIAEHAPPVFLLDANRRTGENIPEAGMFDNRSLSFTTDFPSENFLLAHGISKVVLVQHSGNQPQPDLAHTLRRWQEAGLVIEIKRLDTNGPPELCHVEKPSLYGQIWYRVKLAFGLIPNSLGGFGGYLADLSSAG